MKHLVLILIKLYQRTRIFRPLQCRFYPSCSTYMAQAIERHGLAQGLVLGAWRLIRCQPLSAGGIDQVPERFSHAFRKPCCSYRSDESGAMPMAMSADGEPGLYNYRSKEEPLWT